MQCRTRTWPNCELGNFGIKTVDVMILHIDWCSMVLSCEFIRSAMGLYLYAKSSSLWKLLRDHLRPYEILRRQSDVIYEVQNLILPPEEWIQKILFMYYIWNYILFRTGKMKRKTIGNKMTFFLRNKTFVKIHDSFPN